MAVIMRGGSSGMRSGDYLPQVPDYGVPQPVIDTSKGDCGSIVEWVADNPRHLHFQHQTPDFLPMCGTVPENSTDVQQQDISNIQPNI